jgi:acyl carrier protein
MNPFTGGADEEGGLSEPFSQLHSVARREAVADFLAGEAARALRTTPSTVSRDRSLASCGLDSLAFVELRQRIESEFGITLPWSLLLEGEATLDELAERIAGKTPDGARPAGLGDAEESGDASALSSGQNALWFLYRLAPERVAHNLAFAAALPPGITAADLRRAFQELTDRHAVLQTSFPEESGRAVPRVHPWGEVDFQGLAAPGAEEAAVVALFAEEANRPFALESGFPLRVRWLDRGADGGALLVAAHHIALDFWSFVVLLEELRQLLAGETLPPPAAQMADVAREQAELLAGPRGERLQDYWRQQLRGEPRAAELPLDHPVE